jgi:hypothetical protein
MEGHYFRKSHRPVPVPQKAEAASSSYIGFDRHDTHAALAAGAGDGVLVCERPGGAGEVSLVYTSTPSHTALDNSGFYSGGRYHWGRLTSPVCETTSRFDTLIPSWQAKTPTGTWVELEVRVRSGGAWTQWFGMGVWASGTGSVERHSVDGQEEGSWRVLTDTLQSTGPVFADAYRYRLTLFTEEWSVSPSVRSVCVAVSDSCRHGEYLEAQGDRSLWGRELAVPVRSQMVYPDGGEAWCSPVSLSMVMAYWADRTGKKDLDQPVPAVVRRTYDYTYGGNGNWPFNTAYASSLGFDASVRRFDSLGQVERCVAAGLPVVASIAWKGNELSGAPIPESEGHLLVIRGFDHLGNVVVNDPAGCDDSRVRRVYRRDEFARAWFYSGSGGVAYLVYPDGSAPDRTVDAVRGSR